MAMADDDGRPLALAGEFGACREVADKLARVASRIHSAEYIAYGPGQRWDVTKRAFHGAMRPSRDGWPPDR